MKKLIIGLILVILLVPVSCAAPAPAPAPAPPLPIPKPKLEPEIMKKADFEIALSSDFSNPYMGIVFVKLTNIGNAPAKDIEIKVEFLDAQDNIIGIEELDTWDTEGVIIQPNKSESFEVTTFSSKVVEGLDSYHAYVKWNSIK